MSPYHHIHNYGEFTQTVFYVGALGLQNLSDPAVKISRLQVDVAEVKSFPQT